MLRPLTREQLLRRLDEGGIANAPLAEPGEVWAHLQFQARRRWREVATPRGAIQALLPPPPFPAPRPPWAPCPRWASTRTPS